MTDGRIALPVGTAVEFDNGDLYRVSGTPVGCGGGSILYPVQKQFVRNGILQTDGILYVLKECYPAASDHCYTRQENGEIVPMGQDSADQQYLHQAQLMQLEEEFISQAIYRTASRMIPIRKSAQSVAITMPDRLPAIVSNTVTLMDALTEKGQSLTAWIKKKRRFTPAEAFRIIQQILFALEEVHQAGYLHLDIQDGNVFLRGTLEQKSELATLIDFGCARKLTDGKTAPIRNKVIFTSQGFSAPEILLHNDGSLQLGPEADIYSVGCLTLYLLTGQRANVRELIANRTGVYLRSNQLRRIKCPKHLIEMMQCILTRSLAKEPENRYHSAKDMLEDVTALAEALQIRSTSLSAVKYDAFVCYKHGRIDSAAAFTLQRALENYRAPKGIAEKNRPFGRIFVDEGELSSCADFGQQIRDALRNSAWLIVICSPDTPLSPWVQLEIDTFLEYHDRSRILAVLTAGNPEISFPPQLKKGADDHGEVFAAHALSNTPREAEKQLKGDALLKIAAPMLGTTYDTLKQRHKIYRLQRIAAVTAGFLLLSVGFAAYAMNRADVIARQAVRIEEEYERALINESLFLAQQAEKKLADKDPLGAIELAMQALPSENQDRPVLSEVEYALGKALGIYTTPSVAEDTATPVGTIDTDCPYFFLNPEGSRLFAWDDYTTESGSKLQCWKADTLSPLWEISLDHGIGAQPLVSSHSRLYIMGYHVLHCIDAETGTITWTVEIPNAKAMSLSLDEEEVILLSEAPGNPADPAQEQAERPLLATVFHADTGKKLRQIDFHLQGNLRIEGDVCFSSNLQFIAIPTVDSSRQEFTWHSYNSLYLVNLETGSCTRLMDSQTAICDMLFIGDMLAVVRGNGYTLTTQHNVLYEYNTQYTYWLEAYDLSMCSLLWQQEITDYFETGGMYQIFPASFDKESTAGEGLFYIFQDHCALLDQTTGEILRQYTLPAAAVTASLTEKGFQSINTDGSYTVSGFGIDTIMHIQYFSSGVSEAGQAGDAYFIQQETLLNHDHTICKYQLNWSDDSYTPHFTADSNAWRVSYVPDDSGKILLTNGNQICLTDIRAEDAWHHDIPEEYGFSEYRIVGISADGSSLYWTETGHWDDPECWIHDSSFFALNLATGKITRLPQPKQPRENILVSDILLADDRILMAATWYVDRQALFSIYAWDILQGTLTELCQYALAPAPDGAEADAVYQWENYLQGSLAFDSEKNQVLATIYENHSEILTKLLCVHTDSAENRIIPLQIVSESGVSAYTSWNKNCYHWNREGTQAVFVFNSRIYAVDSSGSILCSIPVNEPIASLQYSPDEQYVLAISQSGIVSKYRILDSSICATLNLAEHSTGLSSIYADDWTWIFPDDNTLLAVSDSKGFLMDISGDSVKMTALINQCIGYDSHSDRLIVAETDSYSGKHTTIGSFPRYTEETLLQKARSILSS